MKQNKYNSVLNMCMIKYFKTQAQGQVYSIFNTSIDADQNVNDLFTVSNSVK